MKTENKTTITLLLLALIIILGLPSCTKEKLVFIEVPTPVEKPQEPEVPYVFNEKDLIGEWTATRILSGGVVVPSFDPKTSIVIIKEESILISLAGYYTNEAPENYDIVGDSIILSKRSFHFDYEHDSVLTLSGYAHWQNTLSVKLKRDE